MAQQREAVSVPGLKRSPWTRFKRGLGKRFGFLWHPRLYTGLLLGFLLGRALPASQVAPLGLAFFAAVRGAGFGRAALPVGLAVVAGAWSVLPLPQVMWVWLGVLFCQAAGSVFRIGRNGPSPLGTAMLAAATAAVPSVMAFGRGPAIPLVFWAGLAGVLGLVFTMGITDVTTGRFLVRSGESPVPAIVVVAAALCGLDGLTLLGQLPLRDVAAGVLVMVSAYAGGPPLGTAAAAMLGVSLLLTLFGADQFVVDLPAEGLGALLAYKGMAYVVAGLLAGTFRDLRKVGVGIAFCLGLVTYGMVFLPTLTDLWAFAYSAGVATLLFWALPARWVGGVPASLMGPAPVAGAPDRPLSDPDSPDFLHRVQSMSRVFKEVSRTFEQVAAVEAPVEPEPPKAFEPAIDRVCHTCSLHDQCWKREFARSYQLFSDLWTQIEEEGPLTGPPFPEALERHCIYPDRVASTLNYLQDLHRSRDRWERRLAEGRTVVSDYLRNVARMLDRFVDDTGAGVKRPEAQPVFRVASGVARLPKRGSHVSGDSFLGEALGADRYLLALSDGMGVGRDASVESKQCVRLLHEILRAGFATEVAVKTVNSALLLHAPDESFATVDLALLDLGTGRAEFVKVGAAPSFVKRGSDVTVVKMASVPVGIINQVDVEPEFRVLHPGDIIVMITDGIWDVSALEHDKERWILQHLAREISSDPEEIAESLLARAVELMPNAGDDMTVLVARIDPLSGSDQANQPARTSGGSWAPVRLARRSEPRPPARTRK